MGDIELENLYNELKVMSIVDHPNIVRVYEYYECEDIVFIVMEFMQGGELFDRIVEYTYYTEKQAADSFRPIVDAVRYCHKLNIVHRDLKPENLLYVNTEDNALIKVSDFGLARFMATKETLYTACGTPNYVAPEVLNGQGYDALVDCWSLGVILYVMLCGFPPFYDEDEDILFKKINSGFYEFPSPYWDTVSYEAKDLICKLLINDPSKRLTAEQILKHPWLTETNNNIQQLQFQVSEYKKYKTHRLVNIFLFRNMLLWLLQ